MSSITQKRRPMVKNLGNIRDTTHCIDLIPGARRFDTTTYRAGSAGHELEEFEIKLQLSTSFIKHSNDEWAAPVLFVPKKDRRLQFSFDYQELNKMNVKYLYQLPQIEGYIDMLGETLILSALDVFNGYWKIDIAKQNIQSTSFVCHSRTFQYQRMPFGLTNAPTTLQSALYFILTR